MTTVRCLTWWASSRKRRGQIALFILGPSCQRENGSAADKVTVMDHNGTGTAQPFALSAVDAACGRVADQVVRRASSGVDSPPCSGMPT